MAREIAAFTHGLTIAAIDEPGPGGAYHRYDIFGYDAENNPSRFDGNGHKVADTKRTEILFQHGPIAAHGRNGVTEEALLSIVGDRLRCFQAGPYPCVENRDALEHVDEALALLKDRTKRRQAAGIEGKNVEQPSAMEPAPTSAEIVADLTDSNARMSDVLGSVRELLGLDDGGSILDALREVLDSRARLLDLATSIRDRLDIDENDSILDAMDERAKLIASLKAAASGDPADEQHKTDAGALGDSDGGKPSGEGMNNPAGTAEQATKAKGKAEKAS